MQGAKSRSRVVCNDICTDYGRVGGGGVRGLSDVVCRFCEANRNGSWSEAAWDTLETLHYTHRQKVALEDALTSENTRRNLEWRSRRKTSLTS